LPEVKWLPEALADVERLYAFLERKNPLAAIKAAQAILTGSGLLETNPEIGKPISDGTGRREWFTPFGVGAYVLRYKLDGNDPIIIRVWHSLEIRSES
jgi:plasmid stabilization system protein ParE